MRVIIKCKSLIMSACIPDFIVKQMMSQCDNFIEAKLFEWNFQLDMNFNMKNMKMIINICIKILQT